jgi:hypothetical protein
MSRGSSFNPSKTGPKSHQYSASQIPRDEARSRNDIENSGGRAVHTVIATMPKDRLHGTF